MFYVSVSPPYNIIICITSDLSNPLKDPGLSLEPRESLAPPQDAKGVPFFFP